ncbi:selenium metabolism-associated LysR family transcriptional regulator [Thermodesulfovibrio hydrogeniphilus]
MDIHQLKVFISVYKTRSFSKAGVELYLTQPTVSEHIKTLEKELNTKLFDRIGKTVIPTKEAEVLFEYALDIIQRMDNLKDSFQRAIKTPSGEMFVDSSSIPGTYILPNLISLFKQKFPNISINISVSDSKSVIENLISGQILLGVVGTKINNPAINYTPFMDDELVIASPNFIGKSHITPEELLDYPFIMREEGSGTRKEMENWLNKIGINIASLKVVCTLGSTDAVKQAIKNGLGISILSIHAIKDEIECKKLKAIRIKNYEMKRTFYIITHTKRNLPYIYKLFYDFLIEKAFTL